jgi:hypothetical protein
VLEEANGVLEEAKTRRSNVRIPSVGHLLAVSQIGVLQLEADADD